jgi:hypothetical protein
MSPRAQMWLVYTFVFLSGGAIALAAEHMFILHKHHAAHESDDLDHAAVLKRLAADLELTPAQHDSVVAIFNRHQPAADEAWRAINRHVYATMDSVHAEIMKVLTPQQAQRFENWTRQQHR